MDQEELALPAPAFHRADNGVGWLPVPGWRFPWLWSGFSIAASAASAVLTQLTMPQAS